MLALRSSTGYETIVSTCGTLPARSSNLQLKMARWTVFDLFCGTGGFSYGMERAASGFETRFGIDLLPVATQTFQRNHPRAAWICGDVRKIRRAQVEEATGLRRDEVDVIVGGPPCQGFSSIRPFRSTNDDDPRN